MEDNRPRGLLGCASLRSLPSCPCRGHRSGPEL